MELHLGRLFDHVHLRVADLAASERFYRAIIGAVNPDVAFRNTPHSFSADELYVSPKDDDPKGPVSHVHISFQAANEEAVKRFYEAGLAAGGRDNGPPGPRQYHPGYYAAFLIDPDGHNVEATYHGPFEKSAASVVVTAELPAPPGG